MLSVWFHEPHLPIETATEYQNKYPDLVKEDGDKAQHHGNITQADAAFGKRMATLRNLGLAENTVVIFTSDNGPEGNGATGRTRGSTGGLRGRKRSVYEGGIRVPFMVRWPGHIPTGKTSDQPVVGADIFATICEIAGAEVPKDRVIDAVSFVPAFMSAAVSNRDKTALSRAPPPTRRQTVFSPQIPSASGEGDLWRKNCCEKCHGLKAQKWPHLKPRSTPSPAN